MRKITFDFNSMFDHAVGKKHGVTPDELKEMMPVFKKAHTHLKKVIDNPISRIRLNLEWTQLPFQNASDIKAIQDLGEEIAQKYESVLFLGIGGSYLGLKAAQDALCSPYYNDFATVRNNRPRVYFEGNNLDPETLSVLLKNLDPKKTFVIVISKSGETTETKAAFDVTEHWLKSHLGNHYGRHVFAITDPDSGTLRKKVNEANHKDKQSFRSFSLQRGVGGRFSEFNMGLLHMAICGIPIAEVLEGAREMSERCLKANVASNPALLYAGLQTILYREKNKSISVVMPFTESLKSTADWYVQLLAESLGKKYGRTIKTLTDKSEIWEANPKALVNLGRTPIPSRGTNDLHSIQQNNIEGENNKTVTFIKVEHFKNDIYIPGLGDLLSGRNFSKLLSLAQEATEWALACEERPSCTIHLPELSPFNWGGLLFFFEMTTAYEGELLNLNAYDQPGVEGYKQYMYYKLNKPGLADSVKEKIEKTPLIKKEKFIL